MHWLIAILSCDSPPNTISPWPKETATLLEHCRDEAVSELQTICWIQAAAQSVRTDQKTQAFEICKQLDAPIWQRECHFRLGEELSIAGNWEEGLYWCSQSGSFAQSCITHSFWRGPFRDTPSVDADATLIKNELQHLQTTIETTLKQLPQELVRQSVDNIQAQFVHSLIVGSGQTRVDLAHESGELGAWFRTVYGIEAARIMSKKQQGEPSDIVEAWRKKQNIYGSSDRQHAFKGRYRHTRISKRERNSERVLSFAGSSRIYANDPEQDMYIAALEGFFWVESTSKSVFQPYTSHPVAEIRWTAERIVSGFEKR
ncbi:MAG: hypothetical protein VX278_07535 [Myxococcota bacterium]|nr:hypothetical protein [Myxococcota bacterium]